MQLELGRRSRHVGCANPLSAWEAAIWDDLRAQAAVDAFLAGARAASTQATYEVQRRQFLQFCVMLGVRGSDRFTPAVLCRWVMGRSLNGYKLSTIELGLNAIADWLPLRGMLRDSEIVNALRAAARQPNAGRQRKVPILQPVLEQLVPHEATYWREARDFAFWLLAWHGFFRGAELVAMQWGDLSLRADGLVILVTRSKTDQAGKGQYVFVHIHASSKVLCPVRALHRLAEFTDRLVGPVFCVHQDVMQPVSKRTMLARLKRVLHDLGLPDHLFGLHSFRSGGATTAAQGGLPERLIKAHGRWVSDVVRVYTSALPFECLEVSQALQMSS